MPLVNVMVNARAYTIACDDGEEEHLKSLAAHVDDKVKELAATVGQVGDQKLMLMAALLVSDEFFEARARLEGHERRSGELANTHSELSARADRSEQAASAALEEAAGRIEDLVEKLRAA